jgi:hypothetical protein
MIRTENVRRYNALKKRKQHELIKQQIFALLNNRCASCGFYDIRALCIDHKNGGGSLERLKLKGMYYKTILNNIINGSKKYQLLCANCNLIKKIENQEGRKRKYVGVV